MNIISQYLYRYRYIYRMNNMIHATSNKSFCFVVVFLLLLMFFFDKIKTAGKQAVMDKQYTHTQYNTIQHARIKLLNLKKKKINNISELKS